LGEDCGNLVGIFFAGKFVEGCIGFKQRGLEWQLGMVVRMKVKVGVSKVLISSGRGEREGAAPSVEREYGKSLAAANQESAASGVRETPIRRPKTGRAARVLLRLQNVDP